jgi:hypothetical protein
MNPLDVKEKRLPRYPRIILGGYSILPAVDDNWKAIPDQWMLPGRTAPMTTQEVRDLADSNNQLFHLLRR